jgi:hypothetical protein
MNNVVRLFDRDLEPERIMAAEKSLLAAGAELGRAVNALSKHFDKMENVISSIGDAETRSQLAKANKLSHVQLLMATLHLTREIGKFVDRREKVL